MNSSTTVLFSHSTESSNQISVVGVLLNVGWFVVALLSTGMIDLAVTGSSKSKMTTYLSNVSKTPQSDGIRQKLAASDDWE